MWIIAPTLLSQFTSSVFKGNPITTQRSLSARCCKSRTDNQYRFRSRHKINKINYKKQDITIHIYIPRTKDRPNIWKKWKKKNIRSHHNTPFLWSRSPLVHLFSHSLSPSPSLPLPLPLHDQLCSFKFSGPITPPLSYILFLSLSFLFLLHLLFLFFLSFFHIFFIWLLSVVV